MFICPNQSQWNTLAHRRAAVQRNLGVDCMGAVGYVFAIERAPGAMYGQTIAFHIHMS
jgi:hypothetical protein